MRFTTPLIAAAATGILEAQNDCKGQGGCKTA